MPGYQVEDPPVLEDLAFHLVNHFPSEDNQHGELDEEEGTEDGLHLMVVELWVVSLGEGHAADHMLDDSAKVEFLGLEVGAQGADLEGFFLKGLV